MSTRPASGTTSPPSMPSSVDFPQPDGPMIVQNSPSLTESATSRSASTAPDVVWKLRATPSTVINGGEVISGGRPRGTEDNDAGHTADQANRCSTHRQRRRARRWSLTGGGQRRRIIHAKRGWQKHDVI